MNTTELPLSLKECTEDQVFAHHWDIKLPERETDVYAWANCKFCDKERLFRLNLPHRGDTFEDEQRRRLSAEKSYKNRRK